MTCCPANLLEDIIMNNSANQVCKGFPEFELMHANITPKMVNQLIIRILFISYATILQNMIRLNETILYSSV